MQLNKTESESLQFGEKKEKGHIIIQMTFK